MSIQCPNISDMRTPTPDPGFSQSLERGLAILSAFTPDRPVLGISELARKLGLTRSTTHRYVATLATLGYLQQDEPTRKYRLGPRVLDLGFSVLGSLELREIAAPHLRRLTDITGHTSNLAIRDDTDVILIDRVRGRAGRYHHLEFSLHMGSRLPSYCSATGKALLAFLPPPPLDEVLDRIEFVQRGPRTLTSKAALRAELEEVRRTGVAVNDEELDTALRSIAAPVRSRSGEVVAAVNMSIPWSPVAMNELVSQHAPTLQAAARQIAARVISLDPRWRRPLVWVVSGALNVPRRAGRRRTRPACRSQECRRALIGFEQKIKKDHSAEREVVSRARQAAPAKRHQDRPATLAPPPAAGPPQRIPHGRAARAAAQPSAPRTQAPVPHPGRR